MPNVDRTTHDVSGFKITVLTKNGLASCFTTVDGVTYTAARQGDTWVTQGAILVDTPEHNMECLPTVTPEMFAAFEEALEARKVSKVLLS